MTDNWEEQLMDQTPQIDPAIDPTPIYTELKLEYRAKFMKQLGFTEVKDAAIARAKKENNKDA